jgi:soluble lytic murein transglycosylase-like protein
MWRQQWFRRGVWTMTAYIVVVNLAVSYLGHSSNFVLSPFHLWDKTRALGFFAAHHIRRLGMDEIPSPRAALHRSVERHKVPRRLAFAIAKAESDFIPTRISRTGAMGMMQLMPDTVEDLGVDDPFHPEENADGGVRYLARLWRRYNGDMRRVAAAYNAGPGRVPRTGAYRLPPETRHYVNRVLRLSRQF